MGPVHLSTHEGLLVGRCDRCAVELHQSDSFDRDIALGTFLLHHPESPLATHRPDVPHGWRTAALTGAA